MKLLLTAFDPFGGEPVNPALEAVKLVSDTVGSVQVVKLEVPTVFGKSIDKVAKAIETEKLKQALVEDENSIKKYFEMYAKADFDDEDTRNQVLEYFVDKIYVYNDRLVITWYYSDDKTSIDLDALTEITETSESNTVDRVSTLLQSDPYTFLPYVLP